MNKEPNVETLQKSAEQFNLTFSKPDDVDKCVENLLFFFKSSFSEDDLAECQSCGLDAPEFDTNGNLIVCCPFCGVAFEIENETEESANENETDLPTENEVSTEVESSTTEVENNTVEVNADSEVKKQNKSNKTHVAKKKSKKGKKNLVKKEKKSKALALTKEEEKALDTQISNVISLKQEMAKNAYKIGKELLDINSNKKWKMLGYKSFFDFCNERLDITRQSCYMYMECAANFTEDEFNKVGVKKGILIMRAPDEVKEKIMDDAKKGASHSTLKKTVDEFKDKSKVPPNTSKKLPLLGRVNTDEFTVKWLDSSSHEETQFTNENKYVKVKLTKEVELILTLSNDEVLCQFRKIELPTIPSQ